MQNIQTLLDKTKNKKLLVIFPHPDDETVMAAGLIQAALDFGWHVRVVCLTHGESGKTQLKSEHSLATIREQELREALSRLQVTDFVLYQFADGKLKDTQELWQDTVRQEIESFTPSILVTYDISGITGHPDHIALSAVVSNIVAKRSKHNSEKLTHIFWPAFAGISRNYMYHPELVDQALDPTHKLALKPQWIYRKYQALLCHKSQRIGKSQPLPQWLAMVLFGGSEYYALAKSAMPNKPKFIKFEI